jgi:uncharacterized protein (DUF934 family)
MAPQILIAEPPLKENRAMSEPAPLLPPLKPKQVDARLWRNSAFVNDEWRSVADDAPLGIGVRILVSLKRWRKEQLAIASTGTAVGVRLDVGQSIDVETDDVARLSVIGLPFPKFSDGRSYSAARQLRDAGYRGEIRATGDVLIDQLPLMIRAGFDAFEITNAATISALERGELPAIPHVYQAAAAQGAYSRFFRMRGAALGVLSRADWPG